MIDPTNPYVKQYFKAKNLQNQMDDYFKTRHKPWEVDHLHCKLMWDMKVAKEMLAGTPNELE